MSDGRRPKRIAEGIREYLGSAVGSELSDPRLAGLVITRVEVTADLGIATAYFRLMAKEMTPALQRQSERTLTRAGSRLRYGLSALLKSKRMPELRFFYDAEPEVRARVDELLHEISLEKKASESKEASDSPVTSDTKAALEANANRSNDSGSGAS
jgi:ribosome-binding factor A